MINPRKKMITGIILALLMSAVLWAAMIGYNLIFDMGYLRVLQNKEADGKYMSVVDTIRALGGRYEDAYDSFYSLVQVKADMAAKACYKIASEGGDACIQKYRKGSVVKIEDGSMTTPAGARQGLLKYARQCAIGHSEKLTP